MKRLIALLFIAGSLAALEVGETSLNHLRIQPDARSQGMGGVSLGIGNNPQSFFANPAGLPAGEEMILTANYLPYPAGIHIGSIGFKPRPSGNLRYALQAFYLNSGKMDIRTPSNEPLGEFSYNVVNLGGNVAYGITEIISVGGSILAHLATADTNIQIGAGADVGVMFTDLLPGLAFGVAVENIALEIVPFVDESGALPVSFGGGVSYGGVKNLLMGLDVSKPLDAPLIVRGGVEFMPVAFLALRGGYSTQGNAFKTGDGADILAGFSGGIGVADLAGISVDYAITPALDLGLFHRFSIKYQF